MRKFWKFITSRFFLLSILLFAQILIIVLFCLYLNGTSYGSYVYFAFYVLDVIAIICILNGQTANPYKLAWISCIAILSFGGGFVLWFIFANKRTSKRQRITTNKYRNILNEAISSTNDLSALKETDKRAYTLSRCICATGSTICYQDSEVDYYKLGQYAWPHMIQELKKAKHFIFIEYFIIEEGKFFNSILTILKQKVDEGVDVRLIYDDFGCMSKIPYYYNKKLEKMGIKCYVFNRYMPFLTLKMNNRDHRKFMIIDGIVGFTGGINLADEYVNEVKKFGKEWKDNCLMIKGPAVYAMTSLFLSQWINMSKKHEDIKQYSYENYKDELDIINPSGFVQPYGDIPYDNDSIGENVYLNFLYKAENYVYLCTPYLVPDDALIEALKSAAKSGVDVRIIIPGVPDKKITYELTHSYLKPLLRAGVKVYKYNDAFVHAKMMISDDAYATIGTINFDLRSLYLHMENAVFMYKNNCINDIKTDFDEMFSNSTLYSLREAEKTGIFRRFFRSILRIFAAMF